MNINLFGKEKRTLKLNHPKINILHSQLKVTVRNWKKLMKTTRKFNGNISYLAFGLPKLSIDHNNNSLKNVKKISLNGNVKLGICLVVFSIGGGL